MIKICNAPRAAALAVLLGLSLSACASLWDKEIYERASHYLILEDADNAAGALTANSYDSLKSVIISAIRAGEREVGIRVTDYQGELTSLSLSALLNEIQTREPIGAYAVEYMAFDLTPMLSQYTITLNIVYKREERPVITTVSGRSGLERAVHTALLDYAGLLTAEMQVYYAEYDAESMARSFYYGNPLWAMEYPKISVGVYPASGELLSRIVELELEWKNSPEELRQKARDTENEAERLLRGLPDLSGGGEEWAAQAVLWLHDALCEAVGYDTDTAMLAVGAEERPGGDPYTAYGALVNALAVSEGHAMAFKLLCGYLDIDCLVVTGLWRGDEHAWNLVRIGEEWYHIGVAFDNRDPLPVYDYFLLDDETAGAESLFWDKNLFPAALPGRWANGEILFAPAGGG